MAEVMRVYYQNVHGLRTKTHTFYENLVASNYDIICLTETWLNSSVFTSKLFGDQYTVYRKDQESSSSMGVVL